MNLVIDLTLVIVAALVGGFLAQRARQPLIVGYLVAGVAVGPFTGGLTVRDPHDVEQLAEVGVALLLFSLGLEVSFRDLKPVRAVAIGGGLLQVAVTLALGALLGDALGFPRTTALWFGSALALSSTMVALKTLQSQGRMGTLSSRVMLGILVVQDLAVVPLMILLPALSSENASLTHVATATLRALVLLGGIVLVSTQIVPRLLAAVARGHSRELFMLTTTAIALGVGVVAWKFGLSLALGAFIAGLIINESDYAHQALSDIIPLRDLFGMLFFVSAGMLLDPALAWRQLGMLATVVAAVVIGKGAILAGVAALFGYRRVIPLATGMTLFQVGEFAFVLAGVGRATGALSNEVYALVLNTAIVTMALTPALSASAAHLYGRLRDRRPDEAPLTMNISSEALAGHVVIAGAGRVGRMTADALSSLRLPFILIESDSRRLQQTRDAGLPVIYGDAAQPTLLEAAAIERARMLLITVPSFSDVDAIVSTAKAMRPDLPIAARAESTEAVQLLHELGINEVTSPEFEAAIDMTRRALVLFDMPPDEILATADAIRRRHYAASDQA